MVNLQGASAQFYKKLKIFTFGYIEQKNGCGWPWAGAQLIASQLIRDFAGKPKEGK